MLGSTLQWGSAILLTLCFASWVIALGGLGSINWLVCSDDEKTAKDVVDNFEKNFNTTNPETIKALVTQLNLPVAGVLVDDIALCSRTWRWEWFCLFFQFAIVASSLVVSVIPNRLLRARFPLSAMLSIATVIIMVAVNNNIQTVWAYWDTHKMFNQWEGVLQKLYMSAAALVAGWVLVIFFNLVWIGFTLDYEEEGKKTEGAPITGDIESSAAATRK